MSLLEERLKLPENQDYVRNSLTTFGYDAAWAIALMLNKATDVLKETTFSDNRTRRLEDFTYDDSEMADVFFNLLMETDFTGITVIELIMLYHPIISSILFLPQ